VLSRNQARFFPHILLQGVGVVEALGTQASKFKVGQRVAAGGWSDGTW